MSAFVCASALWNYSQCRSEHCPLEGPDCADMTLISDGAFSSDSSRTEDLLQRNFGGGNGALSILLRGISLSHISNKSSVVRRQSISS